MDRELNDTRYISRAACGYLSGLYGGLFTMGGTRHVEASKGGITAHLRNILGLNELLHDLAAVLDPDKRTKTRETKPKPRDDHRHHAVDALVTALTSPAMVKELARLSEKGAAQGRLLPKGEFIEAWPGFREEVESKVRSILVSRRIRKKADGGFHDATFYGPAILHEGKQYHAVRKDLSALSKAMVQNIVDPAVKALVLKQLDGRDPKQVFTKPENLPHLPNKKGAPVPIRRVRIWVQDKAKTIGQRGRHPRHVLLDGNHHLEIFEEGTDSKAKWIGRIVTLIEARRRATFKEPIVVRTWDERPDLKFVCSLAIGEQFMLPGEGGEMLVYSIRSVYPEAGTYKVSCVLHVDARDKDLQKATGGLVVKTVGGLLKCHLSKIVVDPIGRLRLARD
jgi:CRISPR-associated endonuclease Csn1